MGENKGWQEGRGGCQNRIGGSKPSSKVFWHNSFGIALRGVVLGGRVWNLSLLLRRLSIGATF